MELSLLQQLQHEVHPTPMLFLGVSGGLDSMALLDLVVRSAYPREALAVIHVHHGIRGDEADRDARQVRETCTRLRIACHEVHVDAVAYAKAQKLSLETAARLVRYQAFADVLIRAGYLPQGSDALPALFEAPFLHASGQAAYVVLAHHRDDLVETLLMNLQRGTGTRGLIGIRAQQGALLRPLLEISVEELQAWAQSHAVAYVEDSTNLDLEPLRNRIRHQLLPYWSELAGFDVRQNLYQLSVHASEDQAFLDQQSTAIALALQYGSTYVDGATRVFTRRQEDDAAAVVLSFETYAEQHPAMRFRILQTMLPDGGYDMERRHYELCDAYLQTPGVGDLDLPGGRTLRKVGSLAWFESAAMTAQTAQATRLRLEHGWKAHTKGFEASLKAVEAQTNLEYNGNIIDNADAKMPEYTCIRVAAAKDRLSAQLLEREDGEDQDWTIRFERVRAWFGLPSDLLNRILWLVDEGGIIRRPWLE